MCRNSNAAHTRGGKLSRNASKSGKSFLQIRRQLKQQRAELGAERGRRFEELSHRIGTVAQPCVVCDPLRRLQRQLVAIGRGLIPTVENLLVRRAIERVVDLDSRKALGVVRQHLRRRQRLRIEAALPLGVVVAGGPDPDSTSVHAAFLAPVLAHRTSVPIARRLAVHQQADLEYLGRKPRGRHGARRCR